MSGNYFATSLQVDAIYNQIIVLIVPNAHSFAWSVSLRDLRVAVTVVAFCQHSLPILLPQLLSFTCRSVIIAAILYFTALLFFA